MNDDDFMRAAIALSHRMMAEGKGGPFGAVIVRDGETTLRLPPHEQ